MTSVFDPGSAPVIETVDGGPIDCDIAIVGSGMGGATLLHAIRDSGARVLVVERGDFLPREDANWSPVEVFQRLRYKNAEKWYDGSAGRPFGPGVHYYVGGNTKVYGACLPRFRTQDFEEIKHHDGVSPAWPVSYAERMGIFYIKQCWRCPGRRDASSSWSSARSALFCRRPPRLAMARIIPTRLLV